MRISDWSSDVCSSDLDEAQGGPDHEDREDRHPLIPQIIAESAPRGGNQIVVKRIAFVPGARPLKKQHDETGKDRNRHPIVNGLHTPEPVPIRSEEHTTELQ